MQRKNAKIGAADAHHDLGKKSRWNRWPWRPNCVPTLSSYLLFTPTPWVSYLCLRITTAPERQVASAPWAKPCWGSRWALRMLVSLSLSCSCSSLNGASTCRELSNIPTDGFPCKLAFSHSLYPRLSIINTPLIHIGLSLPFYSSNQYNSWKRFLFDPVWTGYSIVTEIKP
jgi:hypothetical protein